MKRVFSLALVVCLCLATALSDDYPRSDSIDAVHYRIRLDLADTSDRIEGEAEILFAVTRDSAKEVTLDFAGMSVAGTPYVIFEILEAPKVSNSLTLH